MQVCARPWELLTAAGHAGMGGLGLEEAVPEGTDDQATRGKSCEALSATDQGVGFGGWPSSPIRAGEGRIPVGVSEGSCRPLCRSQLHV